MSQLGYTLGELEQTLQYIDDAVVLLNSPPSEALRSVVDYARKITPVWCVTHDNTNAIPGTRHLKTDDVESVAAQLTRSQAELKPDNAREQNRKRIFNIPWGIAAALAMCVTLGGLLAGYVLDDLSARRAVESADLAELDAYLEAWDDGEHREKVSRERVARVALTIPELGALSADTRPPAQEERAWLEFNADDWSRLPAVVLLRIADEKHGMPAIAAAARQGDGDAAYLMGVVFYYGAFLKKPDFILARKLFGAACAVGLQRSCFNVGYTLLNSSDDAADHAEGFTLLAESCDQGIEISCGNLATWIEKYGQVDFSGETGLSFLWQHCQDGSTYLCAWYGWDQLFNNPDATDEGQATAIGLLRDGCKISDVIACDTLARVYAAGNAVNEDKKQAARLFTISCNGGLARSCASTSEAFFQGEGVDKDDSLMLHYAEKACTYGDSSGCFRVGYAYATGGGNLSTDNNSAAKYYVQSCHQGAGAACTNLGILNKNNAITGATGAQALAMFEKGCNLSNWRGCSLLGQTLAESGQTDRAITQMQLGCDNEDEWGCLYLGEALRDGLTGDVDVEGARAAFKRSLAINSNLREAQNALTALENNPN